MTSIKTRREATPRKIERGFGLKTVHPIELPAHRVEDGHILITGVALRVERNEIDGEVRIETGGAHIHYHDFGDVITVLGKVAPDVLAAILEVEYG